MQLFPVFLSGTPTLTGHDSQHCPSMYRRSTLILHIFSGYSAHACADGLFYFYMYWRSIRPLHLLMVYSAHACADGLFYSYLYCRSIRPLHILLVYSALACAGSGRPVPCRHGRREFIFCRRAPWKFSRLPVSVQIFSLAFLGSAPDKIHPMRWPECFARLYII